VYSVDALNRVIRAVEMTNDLIEVEFDVVCKSRNIAYFIKSTEMDIKMNNLTCIITVSSVIKTNEDARKAIYAMFTIKFSAIKKLNPV